ncbi:DUF2441 domain-containing protein [Acinetobacter indicus]|uniref:DUF2441 domain-containing protein n=1 Tax=Acinetobacter indicus TaxID=756892 RepID=UPI000CEC97E2|nr:DUF2441 domain-containing protein [Acinetobacter indicus]
MAKLYTVDRRGALHTDYVMELIKDFNNFEICKIADLCDRSESISRLEKMFPDGISNHGKQYLIDSWLILERNGIRTNYAPVEPLMEAVLELVRRSEFPNLPSRMSSMFCWESLDCANNFITSNRLTNVNIYEIEAKDYFVGDMSIIFLGGQLVHSLELARKYWAGEKGPKPILEAVVPLPIKIGKQIQ